MSYWFFCLSKWFFWTKAQQPTELIQSSTSSLSQRLWALVDGTRSLVQSQRGGEHLEASQRSVFGFGCFTPETLKLKFQRNGKAKYFSFIIHSHETPSVLERICFIKKKKYMCGFQSFRLLTLCGTASWLSGHGTKLAEPFAPRARQLWLLWNDCQHTPHHHG